MDNDAGKDVHTMQASSPPNPQAQDLLLTAFQASACWSASALLPMLRLLRSPFCGVQRPRKLSVANSSEVVGTSGVTFSLRHQGRGTSCLSCLLRFVASFFLLFAVLLCGCVPPCVLPRRRTCWPSRDGEDGDDEGSCQGRSSSVRCLQLFRYDGLYHGWEVLQGSRFFGRLVLL